MSEQIRPELLISRLTSNNETWRVEAEVRLISLGAAAVEPLLAALHHASPSVRLHAVHALGRIQDERGLPAVVEALGETENLGAVAIAAEKALIAWGAPVKGALLEAATSGPESVRPRALRALGRIGGEDLETPLTGLLANPMATVRTQAAVALGRVAGERAVARIVPLLSDTDRFVRLGVAEGRRPVRAARRR
jgi:HEAT repeat protein